MILNEQEHELVGCCQTVYWNEWPLKKKHEFELVDYFSSPVYGVGRGQYHIYYAIAKSKIPELGIRVEDDLILYISFRTWLVELSKQPADIKIPCMKKNAEGKNLYVKVEKINPKFMKLHHEEPREPTVEQLEKAKKYYSIINAENKLR